MPHQDFLDLFKEDTGAAVSMLKGDADALKATKKALEHALVRYQDGEPPSKTGDKTPFWDCLRRHFSQLEKTNEFAIILELASRHSLAWTNKFIESLVQYNADTQTFTVNTQRLNTLLFLQKHCGLQSCDLSVTTSPYTLPEDVRLFERPIEGETFNQTLLDEVYGFLKKLENSEAMNWAMYLVKQGFLNFSMLHKKIALEEDAFLAWLNQWANQCHIANEMMAERSWEAAYKANDSLEASQRTIRRMVHYGLSPKWLQEKAALSINEATGTTLNTTVASNVTFDSALEYHQSPEVNVYQNTGHAPLEQPSNNDEEPNINNNPEWLQTYIDDPEDRYILYRLKEALSLNEESALERLKFYHDHHRLSRLIELVKQGQLSFAEVAEYDRPLSYERKVPDRDQYDENRWRRENCGEDYNYIISDLILKPRKLPRLLARYTDKDFELLGQSEMARYDMSDYDPKNNPTRNILMDNTPNLREMYKIHEEYLDGVFNKIILPVAEERARLYREWYRLNKKIMEAPEKEHSAGFFGCFYKTPRQEMKLIKEKIALLSGFLKEQCANLKSLEIVVAQNKEKGYFLPIELDQYSLRLESEFETGNYRDVNTLYFMIDRDKVKYMTQYTHHPVVLKEECLSTEQKKELRNAINKNNLTNISPYFKQKLIDEALADRNLNLGDLENTNDRLQINPERLMHYRVQHIMQRHHRRKLGYYYLSGDLQVDAVYHQELCGTISSSDLNSYHTKNDSIRIQAITNEARNSVNSFLKATIGAFLAIPALFLAALTANQVKACSFETFKGYFFRTQSHQVLCEAKKTAETLIQERSIREEKVCAAAKADIACAFNL